MSQGFAKTGIRFCLAFLLLLLLALIPFRAMPPAHAQLTNGGEIPEGGEHIFTLICTCSANSEIYIHDDLTEVVLILVYEPGVSMLYQYFDPFGALYLLGTYRAGAGVCLITVTGEDCEYLPSIGMMGFLPGTGTSN